MVDVTTSATGRASPIVVEMAVAVVPRLGWWLDQNETSAIPPDIVISGAPAFNHRPRP